MRASRQIELTAEHGQFVACAWIGNSESVAVQHYLQVRDEDYTKAVNWGKNSNAEYDALSDKTTQNTTQQVTAQSGNYPHTSKKTSENTEDMLFPASSCKALQLVTIPPRGVEPLSSD